MIPDEKLLGKPSLRGPSTEISAAKTDPSVRLNQPLSGPIPGEVPLERTMQKPQAYKPNSNRD